MTNLKKIIIFLILLIIAIIVIIFAIINSNKGELIYNIDETGSSEEETNVINADLQLVKNRNDYFSVEQCVEKFYMYYGYIFDNSTSTQNTEEYEDEDLFEITESDAKSSVYKMLDSQYIEYDKITEDNIKQKIDEIKISDVDITEMYVAQLNVNVSMYLVKGRLKEQKTRNISDFMIMLKVDASNNTFSVFLKDYIENNYSNIKVGDIVKWNLNETIEKNNVNIYDYKIIDDETYISNLISKYKYEVLYDKETAYKSLDDEYRQKRFKSFENFESYAKSNIKRNVILKLNKYQINKYDDYTEYVCQDTSGNYYIFNEKSVMNYGLILDTYTINIPSFIKKYNKSETQVKVGMNVEKILMAIKEKDYNYVYSKLDDTYKANNFKTVEELQNYIEKVFVSDNVTYDKYNDLGNVYTYKLLINGDSNSDITVIVKLLDDYDFKMSFEIK